MRQAPEQSLQTPRLGTRRKRQPGDRALRRAAEEASSIRPAVASEDQARARPRDASEPVAMPLRRLRLPPPNRNQARGRRTCEVRSGPCGDLRLLQLEPCWNGRRCPRQTVQGQRACCSARNPNAARGDNASSRCSCKVAPVRSTLTSRRRVIPRVSVFYGSGAQKFEGSSTWRFNSSAMRRRSRADCCRREAAGWSGRAPLRARRRMRHSASLAAAAALRQSRKSSDAEGGRSRLRFSIFRHT